MDYITLNTSFNVIFQKKHILMLENSGKAIVNLFYKRCQEMKTALALWNKELKPLELIFILCLLKGKVHFASLFIVSTYELIPMLL